jgi:hypothetical protein
MKPNDPKPPKPNKATSTSVDTIEITPALVKSWKKPLFQRDIRVNAKVEAVIEEIKSDPGTPVLPGIITIGIYEEQKYKLDGQHRLEAFLISGRPVAYCDVRYFYGDIADMADEFVRLNSHLVTLRPDDILKGMEGHCEGLQVIRKRCPFVGYGMVRRNPTSPIVSMSVLVRCWAHNSATETPVGGGGSVAQMAKTLSPDEAKLCSDFITIAERAWGRDPEYGRLYSSLNMTLCMWLYRRIVVAPTGRVTKFTPELFRACLMALSADSRYLDHLLGRQLNDRERSPTYGRLKAIFARRYHHETNKRPNLPSPPWAHHLGAGSRGQ